MKLKISKAKKAASLYVIKSIYVNGKRSTKIVEKLGTIADFLFINCQKRDYKHILNICFRKDVVPPMLGCYNLQYKEHHNCFTWRCIYWRKYALE